MRRLTRKIEYNSETEFSFNDFSNTDSLIGELFLKINELAKNNEFGPFSVGFSWPTLKEEQLDELKKTLQYSLISKIEAEWAKKVDFNLAEAYFLVDFNKKQVFLRLSPVFVIGNYCKFSREIAQTTHFCNHCKGHGCHRCKNGLETEESVEQLITPIFLEALNAKQLKFHGAGREDVDVLMLGKGRPFVVELLHPQKRFIDLKKVEDEINQRFARKISVNSLGFVKKEKVVEVKNSVHEKIYLAFVSCSIKPNLSLLKFNEKINVEQRTPVRVEKRRADLVREKEVTLLEVKPTGEDEKEFELKIKTSHGTYVKEFISGDDGRSVPSISSMLGIECKCKQLDVLKIC